MTKPVDVADIIDAQPVSFYQCLIAFMAWLTLFLDGVDNQSIAYVAPALTHDWGLGRGALRTVFSSGVLGVAIGALIIGPLADRYGRKRVTVLTIIYVALFSLIVTQVPEISALLSPAFAGVSDLNVLMVLRFLTGLGLGAAVPLSVVIVNEFAPKRRRAAMVTLMGCGYAMGSASGGLLASHLVPAFGWQAQFYVAAAMTLVMAIVLAAWLPESIRLLTVQGKSAGVIAILRKINPALSFEEGTHFVLRQELREKSAHRLRPLRLFSEGRSSVTVLIWLCLFMNTLALNYLNNWLPTLTTETGLPEAQALRAAASLQFGGILGVITLGFLADRYGFFKVLAGSFAGGGVCIALIGWAGGAFYPLSATIFASGFFNIGTQITLAALAATLYPTDIRSTGVSWAHGVARIGSIISIMFAGIMLALHWPLQTMYYLVSIPMFFGCVWIFILANVRARTSYVAAEPQRRRAMA
ncbi:MAG TPA: MFS transporter [Micropepsaceae bacterium]|jgi:AAHS family 4-hydroxybenzoate transporter-like MFS transporter